MLLETTLNHTKLISICRRIQSVMTLHNDQVPLHYIFSHFLVKSTTVLIWTLSDVTIQSKEFLTFISLQLSHSLWLLLLGFFHFGCITKYDPMVSAHLCLFSICVDFFIVCVFEHLDFQCFLEKWEHVWTNFLWRSFDIVSVWNWWLLCRKPVLQTGHHWTGRVWSPHTEKRDYVVKIVNTRSRRLAAVLLHDTSRDCDHRFHIPHSKLTVGPHLDSTVTGSKNIRGGQDDFLRATFFYLW